MGATSVELEPAFLLDNWGSVRGPIESEQLTGLAVGRGSEAAARGRAAHDYLRADDGLDMDADDDDLDFDAGDDEAVPAESEDEIRERIRGVRIEVAPRANSAVLSTDDLTEIVKTELGMNIILPRGRITELRFNVMLEGAAAADVYAIDGFPKDKIESGHVIAGKVKLGVTKAFKLVAVGAGGAVGGPGGAVIGKKVGDVLADLLEIELNPWEFAVGEVRDVEIDFSEADTNDLEWYFRGAGILNSLAVALTFRKPPAIDRVVGKVRADWEYDGGWRRRPKARTHAREVVLFPTNA